MYKWITTINGWQHVKYINVGEVTNNSYIGWKKPRRNQQYVTVNPSTGNIDFYYSFVNGDWHKKDENGTEYQFTPSEFTLTLEVNNENYGEVTATVASPNEYDGTTGKIVKNTTDDASITMTATPEEGYVVSKWKRGNDDVKDSAGQTKLTVSEGEDVTYTVVFDEDK